MTDVKVSKTDGEEVHGYYSVEAPGVLRSNASYNVAVNVFESQQPCLVKVKLTGGAFRMEKSVEVPAMTTKLLDFEIPDLKTGIDYFLEAEGSGGIVFSEKIQLEFKEGRPLAYVQLDKQAYKRKDQICTQIIFLNHLLRPAYVEKPLTLKVKSGEKLLTTLYNLDIANGICSTSIAIAEEWPAGVSTVEVLAGDDVWASKSFDIIEYQAPRFEINIKVPDRIAYAEEQMNVGIEARRPDGTPIKGTCTLEVKSVGGFFSDPHIVLTSPFNGTLENTIFEFEKDLDIDATFLEYEWFSSATIMVKVSITDETGQAECLTKLVQIDKNPSREEEAMETDCCERAACGPCEMSIEPMLESEASETESFETENAIKIFMQTKNPKIGEKINFVIALNKPTNYCVYFITARGNIVKSELIPLANHKEVIRCEMPIDFRFVPRAFVFAYYIHDGVLYSDEFGFDVPRKFENKLELNVPKTAAPGESVSLQVQTSPRSTVALLAIDEKSVVLKSQNQLVRKQIFNDLHKWRSKTPRVRGSGCYPGMKSGHVVLTNAQLDGFDRNVVDDNEMMWHFMDREHMNLKGARPCVEQNQQRNQIYRENQERDQVFGNLLLLHTETDAHGALQVKQVQLPNNETTWLIMAFVMSAEYGFGMLSEPEKITVKSAVPKAVTEVYSPRKIQSRSVRFAMDHYADGIGIQEVADLDKLSSGDVLEMLFVVDRNLFAQPIADLRTYASVMYCTGHLHMTTMFPNIVALEYLEALGQLDTEFASEIKSRFPEAIERELAERRSDGAFSWFVQDENPSPHVTSLVLQAFQRAAKYVTLDATIIEQGLAFLAGLQQEDGAFSKELEPYKYPFEKGVGIGLTAMVLLAFLQTEHARRKYAAVIDRGFKYIAAHIESMNCAYDMALSFYAMQLAKHPCAASLKKRINNIAKIDVAKDEKWWSYSLDPPTEDANTSNSVTDLEVTSYVLLGMLESENIEACLPIIRWLLPFSGLRNESMDCAVGLRAVLQAAVQFKAPSGILNVTYVAYGAEHEYHGHLTLSPKDSAKTFFCKLPAETQRLRVSTKDRGSFSGKVLCRFSQ